MCIFPILKRYSVSAVLTDYSCVLTNLGSTIKSTSSAIGGQTPFTPSKKVLLAPILNGDPSIKIDDIQHPISSKEDKINIIDRLTKKSPLKEPKKIRFLENNLDVKVDADKTIKSSTNVVIKDVNGTVSKTNSGKLTNVTKQITIPKEFNFSKRLDKPLRIKNYPTRKSQGIQV